ncbi:protein kinase domain-containing protein [Roseiconus sp. JC912]
MLQMNLNDLSADDLAALDAVCLDYEQKLRAGENVESETFVKAFVSRYPQTPSRELVGLLREELAAIEAEIKSTDSAGGSSISPPTPFQSKTSSADRSEIESHSRRDFPVDGTDVSHVGTGQTNQTSSGEIETQGVETHWAPSANSAGEDGLLGGRPVSQMDTGSGHLSSGKQDSSSLDGDGRNKQPVDVNPVHEGDHDTKSLRQRFSIGPFSVTAVLAKGGMGVVYRAADTRLDRPVAIKMLGFPHLAANDPRRVELVERFEREAKAVAALSHPNIVELFDVGVADGSPYAVMEFLSGMTLAEQLAAGPLTVKQTTDVGMQIASALATAHSSGVIHRDLKPQNVMLVDDASDGNLRIKLVDFGLSRVSDSDLRQGDSKKTRAGMILGTPGYMAPEQARGEAATEAADMFAFGCVLYESMYGSPAIVGETAADRLAFTLQGEIRYPENACEQSRIVCDVIRQCLQKDPVLRPSAADVTTKLRAYNIKQTREAAEAEIRAELGKTSVWESVTRRHALTTIAGGMLGGLLGALSYRSSANPMAKVQAIAVLTPRENSRNSSTVGDRVPLDARRIEDADILASSLVNEFSKIDGLAVRPYRPMVVDDSHSYVELGKELDVEVLIDGVFKQQRRGERFFWSFYWQVIDAKEGTVVAGNEFVIEQQQESSEGQFLARSTVAAEIAKQIGKNLQTTGQHSEDQPDPHSYGCLVKGRAYADIDSTMGLQNALACFLHAHQEDPRLSEPLAASAVTALHLAARSGMPKAAGYLKTATDNFTHAMELDPHSQDARLARAMYEWQAQYDYPLAGEIFEELRRENKYDWQIEHQSSLYFAAIDREMESLDAINRAARLNPMSLMVKIDRARLDWFFNYQTRAKRDVTRYFETTPKDYPARRYVIGLLLDMYEEEVRYDEAAELMGQPTDQTFDRQRYYALREELLEAFPYGPFGVELNRAIWQLRSGGAVDESLSSRLDEASALMFPLLLAKHPAFSQMKYSPSVAQILPIAT